MALNPTYRPVANLSWADPPSIVKITGDEVHIWRASLDSYISFIERFWSALSADERGRAGRFHFQKDRDRFVIARGILRTMLGCYCGVEPSGLRFSYGPYGKPALVSESGLSFNLSHSGGLALYAVACGREVGIDVEFLHPDFPHEQIAERFFSRREISALLTLPPQSRPQGFFNCWTRKEAYIKAKGDGLSFRLDQFDVSLAPGEPAALVNVNGDRRELSRWSLQELNPASDCAAALAVEGRDYRLLCWQWPESV
ncbi:MAG: 4'-phosphopantetheinyl transferase family protein [Candidatus Binatia bacterium]